ncbi:hypothetical protein OAO87_01775 [bacterium]|nr:hypothetical protein [bacterium]
MSNASCIACRATPATLFAIVVGKELADGDAIEAVERELRRAVSIGIEHVDRADELDAFEWLDGAVDDGLHCDLSRVRPRRLA